MSEASPTDARPATLLALVGTSPLPPLRAALEFGPRRLVLAHGSDTRWRAERVKAAAKEYGGVAEVELHDLGAQVFDFRAVRAGLQPFLAEAAGRPWRLCFTGGTKVMAAEAALAHCEQFPDGHRWRSYLDVSTDTLWFTDGHRRDAGAGGGLDLKALAALHGVEITYEEDSGPANEAEGRFQEWLARLVSRDEAWEFHRNAWVKDPFIDPDTGQQKFTGEFDALLRRGHRVVCVEHKTSQDPQGKPAAKSLLRDAGWTLALAQRVFGAATGVLLVHDGDADPTLAEQLREIAPYLNGGKVFGCAAAELGGHFPDAEALSAAFFGGEATGAPDGFAFPEPALPGDLHPPDGAPVLMGLGGSFLGVLASAAAHRRPDPIKLLYSKESERELNGIKDAVRCAMFAEENPGTAMDGTVIKNGRLRRQYGRDYESRVRGAPRAVSAGNVADVASRALELCPPDGPTPVADITTGTKAMNLGLAVAVRARGGCVTYVSPHTRRVHCREHAEVGRVPEVYVDWSPVIQAQRGYRKASQEEVRAARTDASGWLDLELLAAAAEAVGRHLRERGCASDLWLDKAVLPDAPEDLRRLSVAQRPTVVVTAADRALGLAAPKQWRNTSKARKTWAHAAFSATKVLQRMCGPAGRTLALIRPDAGAPKRADELRRWMAWYGGSDPEEIPAGEVPEELTAHEEMYRPELLIADPDTPALAEGAAGMLDALLPR